MYSRFPVALTSTAGCSLRFAISGTCTSASTQLSSKDTASTMNRSRVYTPAVSGDRKMGRKAMMAISVAGIAVWRPMAVIASMRFLPAFRSTSMPSTMTMALSTSIPIASTKAASDTRCMVPSAVYRNRNEPNTVTMRLMPMMIPLLKPMASIRITTTMMTDSIRLMTKVPKEAPTRSG